MDLSRLVSRLSSQKGAVLTLERGKIVRTPYDRLFNDAYCAQENLRLWGIRQGMRVGIQADNSYLWLVFDLAILELGAVSVPFTSDFTGPVGDDLLERHGISLLLLSKTKEALYGEIPSHIAFIDKPNRRVQAIERDIPLAERDPDILSLAFSSGSAGGLKGLVISRNGVEQTLPPIIEAIGVTGRDRLLLFLPMSNFQQRLLCYAALWNDFEIIITDYTALFPAMKLLNPTILIAPPMFYQLVYTKFANGKPLKRALWKMAGAALAVLPRSGYRDRLARLVFRDFYRQFGNRIRLVMTGMAPIGREVAKFFELVRLPLCEAYGLTETCTLTYRPPGSRKYGSVGKPVRGTQIRLESDGEIIVRRDALPVTRYFLCAQGENERTFTGPNEVATGDIGRFDEEGYLYLLGRKRELIVTAGGYKIHPEIVEKELENCPGVAQSVVFLRPGASHLTSVVSLIQPEAPNARQRVREFVKNMAAIRRAAPIGELIFLDTPFSHENGMLRANLKLDRRRIAERFGASSGSAIAQAAE